MNLMLYLLHWRDTDQESECIKDRRNLLINAKKIYDGRGMIINALKNKIFLMNLDNEDSSSENPESRIYVSEEDISPIS